MATTVATFITELDSRFPNAYSDATKLAFVNDVELGIYEQIHKEETVKYYNRTKNLYQYSLPTGVLFEDVIALYVDGIEYEKNTSAEYKMNNSYFYEDGKINIYPVPTISDVEYVSGTDEITFKAISYTSGASELTFASDTITTTGASFVDAGFVVNNVVHINSCIDETGNNKTATITGVSASVLTFDTGTFEAQAETGTVSIKTNCIYTTGSDFKGFISGDVIVVSDCSDETANNKSAIVSYVGEDVLTFAEDTFTAQVESAAVTIEQPSIKMIYRARRTEKSVDTEELLLGRSFYNIYYDYCYAQICKLNREFDLYNNYIDFYNAGIYEYELWWGNRRPSQHTLKAKNGW